MADTYQVLNLAAIIREVDGSNNKGAAALAESILDHPRFRAALGEADEPAVPEGREPASVTEQPSDEDSTVMEIIELSSEIEAAGLGQVDFARAVLARWGNHVPAPPADGEVAELVAALRNDAINCTCSTLTSADLRRAAELLQRQAPQPPADGEVVEVVEWLHTVVAAYKSCRNTDHIWSLSGNGVNARLTVTLLTRAADLFQRLSPPQPVPVSERLPEPSDCAPWPDEPAASAWCWVGSDVDGGWSWEQRSAGCLAAFPDDFTHWLPAHALPLPEVGA